MKKQTKIILGLVALVVVAAVLLITVFNGAMTTTRDITQSPTLDPSQIWIPETTPTATPYVAPTFAALVDPELSWMDYTYDGDGEILAWGDDGEYSGGGIDSLDDVYKGTALRVDKTNHRIYFDHEQAHVSWGIYVYATEGEQYAAKGEYFQDSE